MNASNLFAAAAAAVVLTAVGVAVQETGQAPAAGVKVSLCDGQTTVEVAEPKDPAQGRAVAMQLMARWQAKNPAQAAAWEAEDAAQVPRDDEALLLKRFQLKQPFDNRPLLGKGQGDAQPYGAFTERDIAIWERETQKLVLEGAQVFHDAKRLGSTIAVSCDMCHPDAANTHPETYPKYQTQIGKAVMLRDMINWCLQHPVRAPAMTGDDPRMQAMEAYIYAQRTGKTLQFGRH